MTDHDERISRRYAELAREEPGAAIDAAILGASRRALARSSWSSRWAGPVSIAAVLVLAVGVTLQMQREQPGIERPESPPPQAKLAAPEPQAPVELAKDRAAERQDSVAPVPAPERKPVSPAKQQKLERYAEPKPFAIAPRAREEAGAAATNKDADANVAPKLREEVPAPAASADARSNVAPARPAAAPAAPAPPAAQAPAPVQAPVEMQQSLASPAPAPAAAPLGAIGARAKRDTAESAPQAKRLQAARTEEEVELERIAKLRAEGRNAEADKALEEFRRKYPVYRIPEATWERVKPR